MTGLDSHQFKKMKNYFDTVLDPYNVITPTYSRKERNLENLLRWSEDLSIRYAHRLMGDIKGKRILDIGCGVGVHLVWLAKRGAYVTGIDVSDKRIEKARKIIKDEGLERYVTLYVRDALHTEFSEESFDIVYGQDILMYFAGEYKKFINEMRRILKKNASLIISEALDRHPVAAIFRKCVAPNIWKDFTHYFSLEYIKSFEDAFTSVQYRTFYLTGIIVYLIKVYLPFRWLYGFFLFLDTFFNYIDLMFFRIFPSLKKYSWRIIFEAKK